MINKKTPLSILCLLSFALTGHSSDYYVAPTGNDKAAGTRFAPFKTIQKAADVMQPGDTCIVNPGLYRETVTPKNSGTKGKPIVFRAAEEGTVWIAGTDPVTRWQKHSGHIYKAKMDWSLGKNNQVFIDGKPLQEARWPNDRDGEPMTVDGMKIGGGSVDHIVCPKFPADWKAADLEGAVVWALPEKQWSSWTAMVTGFDAQTKKVMFPSFEGNWWVQERHNPKSKKGVFYLVGALKLLDAPGEWYYDEEQQTLYLWAPDNADPNKLRVEAKARSLGLELTNRSWIGAIGINLHACTIDLDKASHCLIRNSKARYISHTRGGKTAAALGEKSGIYMGGHHNRLESCEISYSAGSGISLRGTDNAIVNCWIHHIDYIGAYCSPINMQGMRHLISHNTIEHTGRDCIKLGGAEHLIQYNDIGYPGRICHDLGAIYSGGQDGGNTRIRYNFVHNNPGGAANVGIYLDNYMKNYIVDHNVVWRVGNGIRLNRPTGFCMVLNNTVFSDINNSWGPWKGQSVQWGCHVMNNLTIGRIQMNREVVMQSNIQDKQLKNVFDVKNRVHIPADLGKGQGTPVAGITPPDHVDVGAWQQSQAPWRAGHDFVNPPKVMYTPATEPLRNHIRNAAFEYARYYKGTHQKVDRLIHWKKTGTGKAVPEHHKGFNSPPANARNSIHANSLLLEGDSGVEQVITTLAPNTEYYFSAYANHDAKTDVIFTVKQGGRILAEQASSAVKLGKKQSWRFVKLSFTTSAKAGPVTVAITKKGTGQAYIDNTGVMPAEFYAVQ